MDTNQDLDEALEETFPASDPPANTPETGIRIVPGSAIASSGRSEQPPAPATANEGGGSVSEGNPPSTPSAPATRE
jgi:hypothetical protein